MDLAAEIHGNFLIPYICVMIAALLPYVWVAFAKAGRGYDNGKPRAQAETLTGHKARANWAQMNAFEAFAPFAAAVAFARIEEVASYKVSNLALLFVVFRIAHGAFYILDKATLRSLVWFGGFACVVGIFWLAIA